MRVLVARIGRPFGLAGEVTAQVLTDEPETRLRPGAELILEAGEEESVRTVSASRVAAGRATIKFAGTDDREAAERLRGGLLYSVVDPKVRPSEDEWYDHQLVGLECRGLDGRPLGVVVGVEHPPAQDLLLVETLVGHLARVPFVSAIVPRVDESGVVVDAPPGLLEDSDTAIDPSKTGLPDPPPVP